MFMDLKSIVIKRHKSQPFGRHVFEFFFRNGVCCIPSFLGCQTSFQVRLCGFFGAMGHGPMKFGALENSQVNDK